MRKLLSRRPSSRRRLKRYVAAAVAGTTLMAGAVAPAAAGGKAAAATKPAEVSGRAYAGRGWHTHEHSWPGPDENQAVYKDGKIYYRSDSYRGDGHFHESGSYYYSAPLNFLRDNAFRYGFSRYDYYTLLSQSSRKAAVQVRQKNSGQEYIVRLIRDHENGWRVIEISRI